MNRLQATRALTKLIAPYNTEPLVIKKELLSYSSEEWELIVEIANDDLLTPVLYTSLQEKNLLDSIKDEQLKGFLYEFYLLSEERNLFIIKQLEEICSILKTIHIKPVLLKGAAALTEAHYKSIGSRVMTDIDFYIPNERVYDAINILKEYGYKEINPQSVLRKNWHDYRRMYREDVMAAVEVHRIILKNESMAYFPELSDEELFMQSCTIENAQVLKPTWTFYHAFLHTQMSDMHHRHHHLALRHSQHFALLSKHYENEIDFQGLQEVVQNANLSHVLESYMLIQNSFFDLETPLSYVRNRKTLQNLERLEEQLEHPNIASSKIKTMAIMIFYGLSYETIRTHYKFKNKILMIIYVPVRILHLLFLYSSSKAKRDNFMRVVRHLSS